MKRWIPWAAAGLGCLLALIAFERKRHLLLEKRRWLEGRIQALQIQEKWEAEQQAALLSEIRSQEDPEWLEMLLIRKLGLIPKGHKKVVFLSDPEEGKETKGG